MTPNERFSLLVDTVRAAGQSPENLAKAILIAIEERVQEAVAKPLPGGWPQGGPWPTPLPALPAAPPVDTAAQHAKRYPAQVPVNNQATAPAKPESEPPKTKCVHNLFAKDSTLRLNDATPEELAAWTGDAVNWVRATCVECPELYYVRKECRLP
jgi:hypothetical protein